MVTHELSEIAKNSRYPLAAFVFVQRGLDFTVQRQHGEMPDDYDPDDTTQSRHVTGRELCEGMRDFALTEYGLLAGTVLRRWRVHRCEDFGHIVFAMVEGGLMHKTDNDTIDDFADVFSFREAFGEALVLT
jgi:uncharacterized repeat protein (TIGR04138 family)